MEKEFQTSFMPKKPAVEERVRPERSIGLLTLVSIIVFFVSLLIAGGLYGYKIMLVKNVAGLKSDLDRAKAAFEPSVLNNIQKLEKKINASKEILSNHVLISPVFDILSQTTLKTVRYTKFSYVPAQGKYNILLSGQARSYRSVASQADVLGKDKNISNPIFSNLKLDNLGNVNFDLSFSVDRSILTLQQ